MDVARLARTARLLVGTLFDADQTYVNGKQVGSTGYQYPPRRYTISADLLVEGDNGWTRISGGVDKQPVTRIIYPDLTTVACIQEDSENCVWQYILQGSQLTCGEPFYWLHNDDPAQSLEVRSITFDGNGNLWVATRMGIQICDQNGRVRAILRLPQGCSPVNEIIIAGGTVTLSTADATWQRRFNVTAPVPGVRPPSQGQG